MDCTLLAVIPQTVEHTFWHSRCSVHVHWMVLLRLLKEKGANLAHAKFSTSSFHSLDLSSNEGSALTEWPQVIYLTKTNTVFFIIRIMHINDSSFCRIRQSLP